MIHNDIFDQQDLMEIAGCRRQSRLIDWLKSNSIPYLTNARNQIIAHRKAVESGMGVAANDGPTQNQLDLTLGFDED